MGLGVVFCLDIVGGVQEESTGLVDSSVVQMAKAGRLKAGR